MLDNGLKKNVARKIKVGILFKGLNMVNVDRLKT